MFSFNGRKNKQTKKKSNKAQKDEEYQTALTKIGIFTRNFAFWMNSNKVRSQKLQHFEKVHFQMPICKWPFSKWERQLLLK